VTVGEAFVRHGDGRQSRVWVVGDGGPAQQVTNGPGADRLPRWSPDGSTLAFLSDRGTSGMHGVYLWREGERERRLAAAIGGAVEEVRWSRDGRQLLVMAADAGSDRAGTQAATRIEAAAGEGDPSVQRPSDAWRRLFLVDVETGDARELPLTGQTAWEADWDGATRIVSVTSADPTESGWYDASVRVVNTEGGDGRVVYQPSGQLQNARISPTGGHMGVVETLCSDRGVLAGQPVLVDLGSGAVARVAGLEDVAFLECETRVPCGTQRGRASARVSASSISMAPSRNGGPARSRRAHVTRCE